jgi:hypothetical protein
MKGRAKLLVGIGLSPVREWEHRNFGDMANVALTGNCTHVRVQVSFQMRIQTSFTAYACPPLITFPCCELLYNLHHSSHKYLCRHSTIFKVYPVPGRSMVNKFKTVSVVTMAPLVLFALAVLLYTLGEELLSIQHCTLIIRNWVEAVGAAAKADLPCAHGKRQNPGQGMPFQSQVTAGNGEAAERASPDDSATPHLTTELPW